jgi:uncharacterized membrane protein
MVSFRRNASQGHGISWAIVLLSLFFIAAGVLHFVMLGKYEGIVPFWIPDHPFMVKLSGVSEILGGIGLLGSRTRIAAGWGLIILLIAIFPANVEMLRQAYAAPESSLLWRIALWIRLPLQGVLIWWVGWATQLRLRGQPRG